MSRGHGKWERAILAALEQAAAFYLTDLLPTPHTRSQVVALNRAARNLAATDKIATCAWMFGAQRHAVYRFGYPQPERHHIISLKEIAPRENGATHKIKSCTIFPRGNSATHRPLTIRRIQEHADWYSDQAYWHYSKNALDAGALDAALRANLRKEVSLEDVQIEFERVMKAVRH